MTLTEFIEQLNLTLKDHPEAANYPVQANDGLEVFTVHLRHDNWKDYRADYVELEFYRP